MNFTRGPRAAAVMLSAAVSTALAAALLIGTALAQTIPPQPPPAVAPAPPPQPTNQFSSNELVDAGHRFFGGVSRGLAMIGAKEAASSLFGPAGWGITIVEEVTKDRSASARAMSAALLGHDAGKDAVRELDEAIWDKNWIVRVAAAQALGECRQRDQIQHLRGLLWDAKPAVRYMAAASIIRLSSSRSATGFRSTKPPGPAAALQMPRTSK